MGSKIRNGKAYEHIIFGLLTLEGFDIYFPLADDQGIDGVLRVKQAGAKPKYYDLQVKGGKQWANIRCKTATLTDTSVLLFFNSKTNEIIWLAHKDVRKYFPETGYSFGDVYLKKGVVRELRDKGFDDLDKLKSRLGIEN